MMDHPTVIPENADTGDEQPVNYVYEVRDKADLYHPHTVRIFTDEKTAEDFAGIMEQERGHTRDRKRYKVREQPVFSSATEAADRL